MSSSKDDKLQELAGFEATLNKVISQKFSCQNELLEVESALEELKSSDDNYKIVGNILIKTDKKRLESDLVDTKKILSQRFSHLEKEQSKLEVKAERLQSNLMKELGD